MNISSIKRIRFPSLLVVVLLCSGAVLLLPSCSKKASAAIIGKWQVQGSKERVEFRKDGTVVTFHDITAGPPGNTRSIEEETTGKYIFTDRSHMSLQINAGNTNQPPLSISCEVHIHGNRMDMNMTAQGENQRHKTNFKRLD